MGRTETRAPVEHLKVGKLILPAVTSIHPIHSSKGAGGPLKTTPGAKLSNFLMKIAMFFESQEKCVKNFTSLESFRHTQILYFCLTFPIALPKIY